MKERLEKLQANLGELDAVMVTSPTNRFYLTSLRTSAGTLLVTKKEAYFLADARYIEIVKTKVPFVNAKLATQNQMMDTGALVAELGIKKLGFEDMAITVAEFENVKKFIAGVELFPIGSLVTNFRRIKDDTEKALIRKAQEITDATFADILKKIKIGMTEKELNTALIISLYENGADDLAFEPIIVSGPNSSLPHGKATDRKLQDGDFLTMDFGAAYKGYASDMTRTVAIGSATDEMRKVYNTVLEAQIKSIAQIKADVLGSEIDKIARDVIGNAGYGDFFGHGLGHGFGLDIHENPRFAKIYSEKISAGAAMTIEPGIYLEGRFGVRIEDDVFVTADGCENITKSPKELIIIV